MNTLFWQESCRGGIVPGQGKERPNSGDNIRRVDEGVGDVMLIDRIPQATGEGF